ncbi:hypothetical protein KUCAC02_037467, partial [Chaenocephalus aceratus]
AGIVIAFYPVKNGTDFRLQEEKVGVCQIRPQHYLYIGSDSIVVPAAQPDLLTKKVPVTFGFWGQHGLQPCFNQILVTVHNNNYTTLIGWLNNDIFIITKFLQCCGLLWTEVWMEPMHLEAAIKMIDISRDESSEFQRKCDSGGNPVRFGSKR